MMVKLNTTDEQIGQAKKEAKELGSLRNSILDGMGNVAGLLSEIVLAENYPSLIRDSTRIWDLIDEVGGKTYDSKASFHKKGEYDERNNFTFHADCWNVEISKLKELE